MKMSKIYWLLVFNILFLGYVVAQNTSIEAYIDSSNILIGDQIKYHIRLQKPLNSNVQFPEFKDTIISNVEVIESYQFDTVSKSNETVVLDKSYLITSFDSANYVIPPVPVILDNDTLFTGEVNLTVNTVSVDTTKMAIYDIKEPYESSLNFWDVINLIKYYLIAFYILLFLFLIFWIIIRPYLLVKRKGEKLQLFVKPPDPPHVIALRELDKIKNEKLWQKGKVKEYHSRLSEIIRKYIEERFHILALEKPTSEILPEINDIKKDYNDDVIQALEKILTISDYVKFAKYNPLPDENDMVLKKAYYFVDETKELKKIEDNQTDDNNTENIKQEEKEQEVSKNV
ncbi:MAG: hypothetical protein Kow0068_07560 [Marinilabiliales bacterium]